MKKYIKLGDERFQTCSNPKHLGGRTNSKNTGVQVDQSSLLPKEIEYRTSHFRSRRKRTVYCRIRARFTRKAVLTLQFIPSKIYLQMIQKDFALEPFPKEKTLEMPWSDPQQPTIIGTGSLRRQVQIQKYLPAFEKHIETAIEVHRN